MNETVLVEFVASSETEFFDMMIRINSLGNDFQLISGRDTYNFTKVSGKITSEFAVIIRLKEPFLAERMRISYIPDELKDKYRR